MTDRKADGFFFFEGSAASCVTDAIFGCGSPGSGRVAIDPTEAIRSIARRADCIAVLGLSGPDSKLLDLVIEVVLGQCDPRMIFSGVTFWLAGHR